jgi:hypothetical protein
MVRGFAKAPELLPDYRDIRIFISVTRFDGHRNITPPPQCPLPADAAPFYIEVLLPRALRFKI